MRENNSNLRCSTLYFLLKINNKVVIFDATLINREDEYSKIW